MHQMAVCDDDLGYLKRSVSLLTGHAKSLGMEIEIHPFSTLADLLQTAEKQEYRMDMLFLDIEFGEEKSFETAKRLSELQPHCQIVFLTSVYFYVMDSYQIPHMYYVIKKEFPAHIDRILRLYLEKEENLRIRITLGKATEILDIRDIYIIERSRRGCVVKLENEARRTSILFEELQKQIRVPYMIRCHNSYLVNLQYVQIYRVNEFLLTNGADVPISRAYQPAVREEFQRWQEVWG